MLLLELLPDLESAEPTLNRYRSCPTSRSGDFSFLRSRAGRCLLEESLVNIALFNFSLNSRCLFFVALAELSLERWLTELLVEENCSSSAQIHGYFYGALSSRWPWFPSCSSIKSLLLVCFCSSVTSISGSWSLRAKRWGSVCPRTPSSTRVLADQRLCLLLES